MKRIKATFTGQNSLGYEHGKEYELIINYKTSEVMRKDGSGKCEYGSLSSFLDNWNNITILTKTK